MNKYLGYVSFQETVKQLEEVKKRADIMTQFGDEGYNPFAEHKPADMKGKKKGKAKTDGSPDTDEVVKKLYGDIKRTDTPL